MASEAGHLGAPKRKSLKSAIIRTIVGGVVLIAIISVAIYFCLEAADRRRYPPSKVLDIKWPTAEEMLDTSLALPSFEARDPDSPTVVRVYAMDARPRRRPFIWSCSIAVDGQRATQYAGWPKDRIAADAEPTALIWHSDPNWVEILLSNGERLKLTWDEELAQQARDQKKAGLYHIKPHYQVLGGPEGKAGAGPPPTAHEYKWQGKPAMSRVAKPQFEELVDGKSTAVEMEGLFGA